VPASIRLRGDAQWDPLGVKGGGAERSDGASGQPQQGRFDPGLSGVSFDAPGQNPRKGRGQKPRPSKLRSRSSRTARRTWSGFGVDSSAATLLNRSRNRPLPRMINHEEDALTNGEETS